MWVATIHRIHIGLFRIAKVPAVEADAEEFEEALYRRVHHRAISMIVTVRLAVNGSGFGAGLCRQVIEVK